MQALKRQCRHCNGLVVTGVPYCGNFKKTPVGWDLLKLPGNWSRDFSTWDAVQIFFGCDERGHLIDVNDSVLEYGNMDVLHPLPSLEMGLHIIEYL